MAVIKLSDLIKKNEGRLKGKFIPAREIVEARDGQESLSDIKKIYEGVIAKTKLFLSELSRGKSLKGKEVINIAKVIVERLRLNNEILLTLINTFAFFEEDDYLPLHSVNSAILAANFGLALEYGENELVDLCASALVHDVGLFKVPPKIINKPSKLTKEEYAWIKKHPAYGLELIKNIKDLPESAQDVVYQHHERIDRTGYPEGKSGEEISEFAKIVAIADVYESATHPRSYRKHKIIPYEGVKMIVQEVKRSFEPKLVKIFLNFITPYPLGSYMLLNNGEIGKVIGIHEDIPLRPVVEIALDPGGKAPKPSRRIDLAKSSALIIKRALDEEEVGS